MAFLTKKWDKVQGLITRGVKIAMQGCNTPLKVETFQFLLVTAIVLAPLTKSYSNTQVFARA